MYKPYSIRTPDFSIPSGGIRVMWGLLGWLLAKGQIVQPNVKWNTPFTAIYPEIYHGNELEAQKVIRYILNKPGVMSSYGVPGPTTFDPNDEIYVFSRIYDTFGVDEEHILFLPILNLHIFNNQKQKRTRTCFFVGKGRNIGLHPKDSIPLDKSIIEDQQDLADFLNTCKVMYTYENPTAMVEIARLCGCRVVFYPEGAITTFSKKELSEKYEPGMDGVSFNEQVPLNVKEFTEKYRELIKTFEKRLDRFIDHTQL